jgi:hypothetical protein
MVLTIGTSLLRKELLWGREAVAAVDLKHPEEMADPSQPYAGGIKGRPRSTETFW